jgi:hypothetical protein
MTFKVVFLWAILRGILDYLSGRPNLHERLATVRLNQSRRAIKEAHRHLFAAASELASALAQEVLRVAKAWRSYHLAHPELWQQPHDERWRR